ncbi:MAG: D-amino acid aminotransferase [Kangiellaceae bacterium]|nr:D-amino acid aminotransferase [Kangiellaceae bacterium]
MSIAYLNGEFLPLEQAKVPVLDRGFLFADSIYEVIPVYAGALFRFKQHIQRLNNSLAAIKLPLQQTEQQWREILETLIECNDMPNAAIYLQITRGAYPERNHDFPQTVVPTILATISPLPEVQTDSKHSDIKGISVITAEDIRWHRCDIKSTGLLANCLLKQQALESGADDTILVRNGQAGEATSSNLFVVKERTIITPPHSDHILPGVTRDFVVALAHLDGIPLVERNIQAKELSGADEIWLTSSTKEIRPVTQLNGVTIGNGQVGPLWQRMNALYQQLKKQLFSGEVKDLTINGRIKH